MNRKLFAAAMILAMVLLIPLVALAEESPMATVETGVNKVLATLKDPGFKTKSKDAQVADLTKVISTIFDFN